MKKQLISAVIIAVICVLISGLVFGRTLVYQETSGNKLETREISLTETETGYSIETVTVTKNVMKYTTDRSLAVLKWEYRNNEKKTDIVVKRDGQMLIGEGLHKGKAYKKGRQIDACPWYQEWGLGLESFAASAETSKEFWAFHPENMMLAKFKAVKAGEETLTVNGREVETIHVKLTLTGLLKAFFQSDLWFRKADGRLVRSHTPGSLGQPDWTVELTKEK